MTYMFSVITRQLVSTFEPSLCFDVKYTHGQFSDCILHVCDAGRQKDTYQLALT